MKQRVRRLSVYLLVSLFVLIMSWEYQKNVSASMLNQTVGIPQESIRLRVLAHSDSPEDQWLKREVRDVVVEQITAWVGDMETIEQAREHIASSLEQLEGLVESAIEERGYSYTSELDFGSIVFPAKLYGNKLYPAGEYEGLLVTIGAGQGENWWCVLFPPLCFVDFGTGDVTEATDSNADHQERIAGENSATVENTEKQVEVRFFIFELWSKIKAWFV